MVSWGSSVVLVLMILIFGFYFDMLVISIALAAVIFLIATASGGSKAPREAGGGAPVAQQPAAQAPVQPSAQPQQPQVVVIKQQVRTRPRLEGWRPTWNRSPVPITIVPMGKFDPLWKKVARGLGGQLGKGFKKIKDGFD